MRIENDVKTCTICLEELRKEDTLRVLPCMHLFHQACIQQWEDTNKTTCPNCTMPFKATPIQPADLDLIAIPIEPDLEEAHLLDPIHRRGNHCFKVVVRIAAILGIILLSGYLLVQIIES